MTNYTELVKALRSASTVSTAWEKLMLDAAAAIEALQADMKTYGDTAFKEGYEMGFAAGEARAEKRMEPKRGEWILTNNEIETIRIHMNAIKEQLCNQYRHREAEAYQTIVDKLAKTEVQDEGTGSL